MGFSFELAGCGSERIAHHEFVRKWVGGNLYTHEENRESSYNSAKTHRGVWCLDGQTDAKQSCPSLR